MTPFGQEARVTLYGSAGVLSYDLSRDVIRGASKVPGSEQPMPLAGFFAAGEIGPVGGSGEAFVHGQTACLALFREG